MTKPEIITKATREAGLLRGATLNQIDRIEKLTRTKVIDPREKQNILSILNEQLTSGMAQVIIKNLEARMTLSIWEIEQCMREMKENTKATRSG